MIRGKRNFLFAVLIGALAIAAAAGPSFAKNSERGEPGIAPLTTTTYHVGVGSFSPCLGEVRPLCAALWSTEIQTSGVLQVQLSNVSFGSCGGVLFQFFLGQPAGGLTDLLPLPTAPVFVLPDITSTGVVDLGPVPPGTYGFVVQPVGVAGGCATGPWSVGPWSATIRITTSALVGPPTSKEQCKKGGWATFNNPTFKNQGGCVSYVVAGGKP